MDEFLTSKELVVGDLTFYYRVSWNGLFGMKYFIDIMKRCENIPGFAPTYYDSSCGQLVMDFKGDEQPYWLHFEIPANLVASEIKSIYDVLNKGFNKEEFATEEALKEHLRALNDKGGE